MKFYFEVGLYRIVDFILEYVYILMEA